MGDLWAFDAHTHSAGAPQVMDVSGVFSEKDPISVCVSCLSGAKLYDRFTSVFRPGPHPSPTRPAPSGARVCVGCTGVCLCIPLLDFVGGGRWRYIRV